LGEFLEKEGICAIGKGKSNLKMKISSIWGLPSTGGLFLDIGVEVTARVSVGRLITALNIPQLSVK